ncbi:DNA-directed DNA polymerase I [Candidatus Bathyarchaeota archaeon]|nr:DNA-directed DNA polymerase I [Candidatus Bathyarchaeota archaeon]
MEQKHLTEFSHGLKDSLKAETPSAKKLSLEKAEGRSFPPVAPEELPSSYFVSATYDGKSRKAVIKLYEPDSGQIHFWYDNTGHKPYCLTNLSPYELEKINRLIKHPGFIRFELTEKFDPLLDRNVKVTKVLATDPLAIGGRPRGCIRDIIPEEYPKTSEIPIAAEEIKVWESRIKYYESYIYDRKLWPGMIYEVKKGNVIPKSIKETQETAKRIKEIFKDSTQEEQEHIERWARLLEYPAPTFHRAALDIEVYSPIPTRMPDSREAAYPVVCASFYDSDGQKRVLLLKRQSVRQGTDHLQHDVRVEYFDSEDKLIRRIFNALWKYPFIITFNGDDFDLRYLANRARKFGIGNNEIPIDVGRRVCLLKYGIHIDLYKFFFNRSIQIYAFSNRYRDVTLDDIGQALIGIEKIKLEKTIGELTYTELAQYCLRDSEITLKLTSFEDDLVMKLVLVLARISSMPMEDVSRQGVSRWIRNFMHREHRRKGMLIPNAEDILAMKGKTATKAIIKGKKYKGAVVVEPTPGVHFNVAVMDFPSLYPSIMKVWNLGYQSIRCSHPECRSNAVPDTPHWVCRKTRALESLLVGSLRDLRVHWYKPRSRDKTLPEGLRDWYNVIQGAVKVILNASYGVFGAESFDLYCPPVAEATAAIGRHSINRIIDEAKNLNIQVLYGDTDSVFLKNPAKEQIESLAQWTEKKLRMSLDVEKVYRYAVFSQRKKNYLGVQEDGSIDVKGLTGKKRHIPPFIKRGFNKMKERLTQVRTPGDFEEAKKDICGIVYEHYVQLRKREWKNLSELAFNVVLGQSPEHYVKTTPQHVKAAKMLQKRGIELKAGDLISFVKVAKEPHVKPVQLAAKYEIDVDKYVGYLHSTFSQVLDALGLDFEEIIGLTKLERFM